MVLFPVTRTSVRVDEKLTFPILLPPKYRTFPPETLRFIPPQVELSALSVFMTRDQFAGVVVLMRLKAFFMIIVLYVSLSIFQKIFTSFAN